MKNIDEQIAKTQAHNRILAEIKAKIASLKKLACRYFQTQRETAAGTKPH